MVKCDYVDVTIYIFFSFYPLYGTPSRAQTKKCSVNLEGYVYITDSVKDQTIFLNTQRKDRKRKWTALSTLYRNDTHH